jgi:C_GCAxxG_C_C family probable redox protein
MNESLHSSERAVARSLEHFASGFNCAEAVLLGVTESLDWSGDGLPMIATGFGGGIARHGETCGAVIGAVMAIGLFKGRCKVEDLASRDKTYAIVDAVLDAFCERHGSLGCRQLIGCDLRTEDGRMKAAELRTHQDLCPKFVASAASLATEEIAPKG